MKIDRRKWYLRWLDGFSQLLNVTFFNGDPDESISGRCWRQDRKWAVRIIDALFSFQTKHCRLAYQEDLKRANARILTQRERGK